MSIRVAKDLRSNLPATFLFAPALTLWRGWKPPWLRACAPEGVPRKRLLRTPRRRLLRLIPAPVFEVKHDSPGVDARRKLNLRAHPTRGVCDQLRPLHRSDLARVFYLNFVLSARGPRHFESPLVTGCRP